MRKLNRKELKKNCRNIVCPLCNKLQSFLWTCPCGVIICDECMKRDLWGFTCNNITWVCPDCGRVRSY